MPRGRWGHWAAMAAIGTALLGSGGDARAALNGFGLQLSTFAPSDETTEELFDLDQGPIPQFFYRFQGGDHGVVAGFGFAEWEREDSFSMSRIDFFPVFANYRYIPWQEYPVSLVVGAGLGYAIYDADIVAAGGFFFESQTGLFLTFEPLVGVEFRASKNVRLNLDYKHAVQLLTTEDLDGFQGFTEIDMSGGYTTFGLSFLFGD